MPTSSWKSQSNKLAFFIENQQKNDKNFCHIKYLYYIYVLKRNKVIIDT